MDCATCQDVISAMLDGEAAPGEEGEAAAHLERCADCRAHRDALAQDRAAMRAWAPEVPHLPEQLRVRRHGPRVSRAWALAWAATIVIAFAAGLLLGGRPSAPQRRSPPSPPPGAGAGAGTPALALVEWRVYPREAVAPGAAVGSATEGGTR